MGAGGEGEERGERGRERGGGAMPTGILNFDVVT